ncbi:MAG: tRNA (guanine(46)-N(7))-methyltransferase TrmB [Pirellula sp.]|jgi:tRNA (guanine-N7-)-methyltransferase|nr:methyltransferase domain-containing protein [Pirellula sp.]
MNRPSKRRPLKGSSDNQRFPPKNPGVNPRSVNTSDPTALKPGDIELEMGIPIPGAIQPKEQWTQTAIKRLPEAPFAWPDLFRREAPIAIDIGCGNGRFTISSAVRRPDWDHLGIDALPTVIRYATRRGNQRGLTNVRFAVSDGWKLLDRLSEDESVDEFHIYHPQPFSSSEDSSRRMLTPQFLGLLHRRLKPNGKVFLQTDRKPYWLYITNCFSALFDWEEILEPWPEDPHGRSRREMLSQNQKLTIYRGIATRRSEISPEDVFKIVEQMPAPEFAVDRAERRFRPPSNSYRRSK